MSERKSKEIKEQAKVPVGQISIFIFNDGSISVGNVPNNFHQAMQIMAAATGAVAGMFVAKGMEGKLDDKLNIEQSPLILPADNKIVALRN